MKTISKIGFVFFGATLLSAAILLGNPQAGLLPSARASVLQDDQSSFVCSLGTIKGKYGTEVTGFIVSAGPIGPVADVGVITFDGLGGASQTSTVSLNGVIIPHRSSLSGSYTVNPDCTGSLSLTLPSPGGTVLSTSNFVILNYGHELRTIVTGAGRVLSGNAKRQ